jgi:hypothetical protein
MSKTYNPTAIFEQNPSKGGVCPVKQVVVTLASATANQTVVAAVAGKSILVLDLNCYSQGAASTVTLKNGSGGTVKRAYYVPANTLQDPNVIVPPTAWGLAKTDLGVGLFADTTGAAAVVISLNYIEVA